MKNNDNKKHLMEQKKLDKFVSEVKDGKYGNVERSSIVYSRLSQTTEVIESAEPVWYYGLD
jgi:uncharacterized protein YdaT